MLKPIALVPATAALALALSTALAGGGRAETNISMETETCLRSAAMLEQLVDDRGMSPEEVSQIDDMLTEMENYCDRQQFDAAMSLAGDITGMISKQK